MRKYYYCYYFYYVLIILLLIFSLLILMYLNRKRKISRDKTLYSSIKFMKECFKGELINNNSKKISINPKISAIIPAYNCQNTILASIRSIQNQNMGDIEIIIVNDNSKDNTSIIINALAKEDNRIKILNNEKNMATLYSRNIGILMSRGKYIMNLDNDDLFMYFDVFTTVYNEAEKGKYDIIGFQAIDCPTYNPLIIQMKDALYHSHKEGLTLYQPKLTYFAISSGSKYNQNDLHVWGRLTKANLYKKVIYNFGKNALGEIRSLCFVTWGEDSAMSMAIFRNAKSYKYIKKYGIFHFIGMNTSSNKSSNDLKIYGELFFLDAIIDFSHNNFKGKKYSIEMAKERIFPYINELFSDKNRKYLKAIFCKMMKSKYIPIKFKKEIKKKLDVVNI